MKDLFDSVAWLFEEILFLPFHMLRELELTSWFIANLLNWIFMIIAFAAFIFWMLQLKKFNDNNEEDRSTSAHSYLE